MNSKLTSSIRSHKRIAVCLPDLGGGGAERVALQIVDELLDAGHEVDLVLVKAVGELLSLVPKRANIVDLGAKRIRGALLPLVRYFRRLRPDAMHVSMWPLTTIAIAARILSRVPVRVVTCEQVSFAAASALPRAAIALSAGFLYRFADHRTVVAEGALRDLAALTRIDRDRFEVIHNSVAIPDRIASTAEAEATWGGSPRIISVGSFKVQKNHALLLRAFARLGKPSARLMILGEGPLRADLEALAEGLGIADQVILPGFAIDPWPYYASADLFVLSSDVEGLPLVLVEALAAGLPIVSTDCPSGPREVLDDGRFGTLVPTGDVAALASAMTETIDKPGNAGLRKKRAAKFAGNSIARYRQLLEG